MLKRIYTYSSLEDSLKAAVATSAAEAQKESTSYEYDALIGNLSYQRAPMCDGCFCADTCPDADHPMLRRIVRWVKIIARSKHGMTVLFSIVPLLIGVSVGVYIGRKWEQTQQQQHRQLKGSSASEKFENQPFLIRALHQAGIWFYVFRTYTSAFLHFMLTAQFSSNCDRGINIQSSSEIEDSSSVTTSSIERNHLSLEERNQHRQSGVELELVPRHIAVIMDGNRRYGKSKYNSASRGHVDGGYKLRDMVNWCIEECIQEMTVYAFSTENWNRSPAEIDALMSVFCQQCDELRKESIKLQIIVRVLSTQTDPIPDHVKAKLKQLEDDTRDCQGTLILNVCLSYGSRGEIVAACQSLAADCQNGKLSVDDITEEHVESRLLTGNSPPPDILLRTSGEVRLSNFLLWQCAYTEFFFLSKHWPDLQKEDLLEVIRGFAHGRKRRFGS